jgi:hypothetical protein
MGGRHHEGLMERTEEEVARLRNRTQITHEGEAYCPNPNLRDLVNTSKWQKSCALYAFFEAAAGMHVT